MKCGICGQPATHECLSVGDWIPVCAKDAGLFFKTRLISGTEGKPDLTLLPGDALNEIALAMASGLDKYPRDDWKREDLDLNEYAGKALRHIYQGIDGKKDESSGLSPYAHAAADLLIILWHLENADD